MAKTSGGLRGNSKVVTPKSISSKVNSSISEIDSVLKDSGATNRQYQKVKDEQFAKNDGMEKRAKERGASDKDIRDSTSEATKNNIAFLSERIDKEKAAIKENQDTMNKFTDNRNRNFYKRQIQYHQNRLFIEKANLEWYKQKYL